MGNRGTTSRSQIVHRKKVRVMPGCYSIMMPVCVCTSTNRRGGVDGRSWQDMVRRTFGDEVADVQS